MKKLQKKNKLIFIISLIITAGFLAALTCECLAANSDTEKYLKKAQECYKNKDYEAAINVLAEALKKDPANKELLEKLGEMQKKLEEEKAKLEELQNAEEIRRLNIQAQAYYDKGELSKAIQFWSKVLAINPDNDQAAWYIQKAQTRLSLSGEAAAEEISLKKRDYSKKIKKITDDMLRLIEDAQDKIESEKGSRREKELEAIKREAEVEEQRQIYQRERRQQKEEAFILSAFEKGQKLYADGEYDEAIMEWETILPLLSQDDELRHSIEDLKAAIEKARAKPEVPEVEIEEAAEVEVEAPPAAPEAKSVPKKPEVKKEAEPQKKVEVEPKQKQLTTEAKKDKVIFEKAEVKEPEAGRKSLLWVYVLALVTIFLIGAGWVFLRLIKFRAQLAKAKELKPPYNKGKDFDPNQLQDFIKPKKKNNKDSKDIFKRE